MSASYEAIRRDAQLRELQFAIEVGCALPAPKAPRPKPPGFAIGSCSEVHFSPDGRYLLAATPNGCFFWDVAARKRVARVQGVPNPVAFDFHPSGSELLMRNEQGQIARVRVPGGERIARFKARFKHGLDGGCCYSPDGANILAFGHGPQLLLLDANDGRVLQAWPLERETNGGLLLNLWRRGEVVLTLRGTSTHPDYRSGADVLLRWRWPLSEHSPERIIGPFDDLHVAPTADQSSVILHWRRPPTNAALESYWVDVRSTDTLVPSQPTESLGAFLSEARLSHDGRWVAVSRSGRLWLYDRSSCEPKALDARDVRLVYAPTEPLAAITGKEGVVVPLDRIGDFEGALRDRAALNRLSLRTYARATTLKERRVPPRVQVFEEGAGWRLQGEQPVGRMYRDEGAPVRLDSTAEIQALGDAVLRIAASLALSEAGVHGIAIEASRGLLRGVIDAPNGDCSRLVLVTFAPDVIELWSAKTEHDGRFTYHYWPVAALRHDASGEEIGRAIREMLNHCVIGRRATSKKAKKGDRLN